jgi:S1-C subfamily serine protease
VAINGKAVTRLEDVWAHLTGESIGQLVTAQFLRGGVARETSIAVGERPNGGN